MAYNPEPEWEVQPVAEGASKLTEASRNQIVYMRLEEIKDDRTAGVKRMKKER